MIDDFEFKGWDNLRAVFFDGAGKTKSATPEEAQSDFWYHVGVEQGVIEKGSRQTILSMDEARIALSCDPTRC